MKNLKETDCTRCGLAIAVDDPVHISIPSYRDATDFHTPPECVEQPEDEHVLPYPEELKLGYPHYNRGYTLYRCQTCYEQLMRARAAEIATAAPKRQPGAPTAPTPSPTSVPQGGKRCGDCEAVKPVSEFNVDRGRPDGLFIWCKACRKKRSQKPAQDDGVSQMLS